MEPSFCFVFNKMLLGKKRQAPIVGLKGKISGWLSIYASKPTNSITGWCNGKNRGLGLFSLHSQAKFRCLVLDFDTRITDSHFE